VKVDVGLMKFGFKQELDTALVERVSEYTVRVYITPDSALLYLNHARIA